MGKPLMIRWTTGALNLFLAVFLLVSATGLVVMRVKGMRPLMVATDSMQPVIQSGDLVVASVLHYWPSPGQIISYNSTVHPGELVTHRVLTVDRTHGYLVTKGDNAPTTDNPIRQSQIVGRVRWHSTLAGKIIRMLRNPLGLVASIYVPALLIISFELKRVMRKYRRLSRYQIVT